MIQQPESASTGVGERGPRWLLPVGAAALVVGVVIGIVVATRGDEDVDVPVAEATTDQDRTRPRFVVTTDSWGAGSASEAWFQVFDVTEERVVEAVPPPSPAPGEVTSIVAGPDGTFVAAAWDLEACETSLYRFTLSGDGHVTDLAPVTRESTPALAAGLAISPDGRRIAYATGPCGDDPRSSPPATAPISLAVLDTTTGRHRTWTTSRPTVVGEIVWAGDSRTLGYTTAEIDPGDATVGAVQVRATDTEKPGTDLLSGRVLFTQEDRNDTVTTAVMAADGRSGYGALQRKEPPSTVLFRFTEGQPVQVTKTIPEDPDEVTAIGFTDGAGPRYACLGGLDAFGRVVEQELSAGTPTCTAAYTTPD